MSTNEFEGRLVRLRAVEPEDWEAFARFDVDTDLARRDGNTHLPGSNSASRDWATTAAKRPDGDGVQLAIEALGGPIVGAISVGRADRRHGVFSYGLGLGREFWRRGFGTEAVVLLLRFYFRELRYEKVDVEVYAFNEASLAFHEHLGFTREGVRRSTYFTMGERHDVILYGLTRLEFEERVEPRIA